MNDTSIEFEIADLDVVSDNEIKEQLLKFNTPQRPSASFTLATGCHQQGHKPARALACVPVHEQVYELYPFWLTKRDFC